MDLGEPILHEEPPPADPRTRSTGNDGLLVVLNKEPGKRLDADWRPRDLTTLERRLLVPPRLRRYRSAMLRQPAADALRSMFDEAREHGVRFKVRSAYRSYEEQQKLYKQKVKKHGPTHAARFSAEAGRSQHQLGTAVDLTNASSGWRIEGDFAKTRAGNWLAENAHRFGYVLSYPNHQEGTTGYAFEPWHFRYIGRGAARELRASGLILDEYLESCSAGDLALRCPAE